MILMLLSGQWDSLRPVWGQIVRLKTAVEITTLLVRHRSRLFCVEPQLAVPSQRSQLRTEQTAFHSSSCAVDLQVIECQAAWGKRQPFVDLPYQCPLITSWHLPADWQVWLPIPVEGLPATPPVE